jgi:glycine C-acetyltransferase
MDTATLNNQSVSAFYDRIKASLVEIESQGLTKPEHVIASKQNPHLVLSSRQKVINFCANNYLGLADHPDLIEAASKAVKDHGAGMASVRFICGTHEIHKELETKIAAYCGFEDAITFAACFDANGAVFEPLLGPEDAIISDSLNHASIIDGIRLCKAQRYPFKNGDHQALEDRLIEATEKGARTILIATDGVFSMDGSYADLITVRALADRYGALIMVDDCHATGFVGPQGRGTAARAGIKIDILTGTFGKALGGGMGGFICARSEVIALLRQRARPYLFSNALSPSLCASAIEAIRLAEAGDDLRSQLVRNAVRFRDGLSAAGFDLLPGEHPIIPVMLYEAQKAQAMAARLLEEGIYVIGFSYPVVPKGFARIRTQMSAAHTDHDIDMAVAAFIRIGKDLSIVG